MGLLLLGENADVAIRASLSRRSFFVFNFFVFKIMIQIGLAALGKPRVNEPALLHMSGTWHFHAAADTYRPFHLGKARPTIPWSMDDEGDDSLKKTWERKMCARAPVLDGLMLLQ